MRFPDRARPIPGLSPVAGTPPGDRGAGRPSSPAAVLPVEHATATSWKLPDAPRHVSGEPAQVHRARRWPWIVGLAAAAATVLVLVLVTFASWHSTNASAQGAPASLSTPPPDRVRPAPLSARAQEAHSPRGEIPSDAGSSDASTTASGAKVDLARHAEATPLRVNRDPDPTATRVAETEKRPDAAPVGTRASPSAVPTAIPKLNPADPAASVSKPRGVEASKPTDSPTGKLSIIVKPWAMVSLNGGRPVQTPYIRQLPVGSYRVRLVNEVAEKDQTMTVTVSRDQTTTIQLSWAAQ